MLKNRFGLDVDNTVFVIDSPVTALMISIIAGGDSVTIVLEKKRGLDTENGIKLTINIIRACLSVREMSIVELPHRFYIPAYKLNKIIAMKRETRTLYACFSEETVFVGAPTSTFMRCLQCRKENIVYLYHGMSDHIEKNLIKTRGLRFLLKKALIGGVIGLPYSSWCGFWSEKAFSFGRIKNNETEWVDIKRFESSAIQQGIERIAELGRDRQKVLFFPIISGHTSKGIISDTSTYNSVNVELLTKHINPEKEIVFVKYHPWLYRASKSVNEGFISCLKKKGIEAYDIGRMIPNSIGGALLPTEAIYKYVQIDKIIAQDTSTVWYIYDDKNIKKILDITFCDTRTKKYLNDCYRIMNSKCEVEDLYLYK